jgi:hypothetical protein
MTILPGSRRVVESLQLEPELDLGRFDVVDAVGKDDNRDVLLA